MVGFCFDNVALRFPRRRTATRESATPTKIKMPVFTGVFILFHAAVGVAFWHAVQVVGYCINRNWYNPENDSGEYVKEYRRTVRTPRYNRLRTVFIKVCYRNAVV